jgi:hypothetical protein
MSYVRHVECEPGRFAEIPLGDTNTVYGRPAVSGGWLGRETGHIQKETGHNR